MSEEKVVKVNYSAGNSHRQRDEAAKPESKEQETAEAPRLQKIEGVQAKVQKKTLGRKIAETFNGDDTKSVGDYVLFEVLLPSAKELLVDVLIQGVERKILGASSSRNYRSGRGNGGGGTGINYNNISKAASNLSSKGEAIRNNARVASSQPQDFADIIFDQRGQAEEVLDQLRNVVDGYGVARVADLNAAVGVTGPFTDNKFGWDDLSTAAVKYHRGAYIIDFPRPIQIN